MSFIIKRLFLLAPDRSSIDLVLIGYAQNIFMNSLNIQLWDIKRGRRGAAIPPQEPVQVVWASGLVSHCWTGNLPRGADGSGGSDWVGLVRLLPPTPHTQTRQSSWKADWQTVDSSLDPSMVPWRHWNIGNFSCGDNLWPPLDQFWDQRPFI